MVWSLCFPLLWLSVYCVNKYTFALINKITLRTVTFSPSWLNLLQSWMQPHVTCEYLTQQQRTDQGGGRDSCSLGIQGGIFGPGSHDLSRAAKDSRMTPVLSIRLPGYRSGWGQVHGWAQLSRACGWAGQGGGELEHGRAVASLGLRWGARPGDACQCLQGPGVFYESEGLFS